MRIDGNLPIHVARAYGLKPTRAPGTTQKPREAPRTSQTSESTKVDGAKRLIAGTVRGEVNFDGSGPRSVSSHGSLSLYTRAADLLEAATGIQLGRRIDVKG